jgi:hypothetical protein
MERTHSVEVTERGLQAATFWFWNTACMGSCASQGNCVVLGLVILRITFAICSKIGLFLNFHFFSKVWSIKLLSKHFARDVNALAKVLRMSSARRNCDQIVLAQRGGPLYVCTWRKNLQRNFRLVNPKFASVVHMLSSRSSVFIWYFVILTGLENGSLVLPRYLDLVRTLYGLIAVTQMRWQTENTLGQIESSRTYYSINRNLWLCLNWLFNVICITSVSQWSVHYSHVSLFFAVIRINVILSVH